ncbi:MAG: anti-sigma factor [Methylovirgula sp.]|uniref:anti-sigma factor n=1 Tax=Methylovirgula sp. TaxID=1978224 RepID=UPI003075F3C5
MSDEPDMQAAEYVLGTLPADERRAFEALLARDPATRLDVENWEHHLAPLNDALNDVEPSENVWQAIEAALPESGAATPPSLLLLRRSRNRWRTAAIIAGALAAGFAAVSIDHLLKTPREAAGSYVAVVNRTGDQPALIIRVDLATRTVFVRPVATSVPQGRSLELWYIGNHLAPKSMGLVDKTDRSIALPQGAPIEKANFAVTVEPQGGSPSGAPTGPIVYSGQLLKE